MAERIQVELVDDIDGAPAQHTVTFALDGVTYEIDLSDRHAEMLRSVLGRYINCARKAPAPQKSTRQQEREERRNRQANRQLTEQIRGAAQRTRERLSRREEEQQAEQNAATRTDMVPQEQELPEPTLQPAPTPKDDEKNRVPAVSLPQFSSAVD